MVYGSRAPPSGYLAGSRALEAWTADFLDHHPKRCDYTLVSDSRAGSGKVGSWGRGGQVQTQWNWAQRWTFPRRNVSQHPPWDATLRVLSPGPRGMAMPIVLRIPQCRPLCSEWGLSPLYKLQRPSRVCWKIKHVCSTMWACPCASTRSHSHALTHARTLQQQRGLSIPIISWVITFLYCAESLRCGRLFATPGGLPAPLSMRIFQAGILEWVAMLSSKGSSWPRDWMQVSRTAGGFFSIWTTREAHEYLSG